MGTTIDDEAEFASQQMLRNSRQVVIINCQQIQIWIQLD